MLSLLFLPLALSSAAKKPTTSSGLETSQPPKCLVCLLDDADGASRLEWRQLLLKQKEVSL
jgi:hypothetical protein